MLLLQTMHLEFRLLDYFKLATRWKKDNDVTIFLHDIIVKILLYLRKFCCLKDKPEIGRSKIPNLSLPNIMTLVQVKDTKFDMNFLIKCY